MRVLVTGASGFVGSHLAPRLRERGHEVWTLYRHVSGRYGEVADGRVFADLRDHFAVRKAVAEVQPEAVIHTAALSSVAYSYDHPQEVNAVNYMGTVNLAEACLREAPNLQRFLFAGTSEEYGVQTAFPIREDAELRANSPYSASKIAADVYLRFLHDAYRFPVTVLRPFNTFGRKAETGFLVERVVTQLLKSPVVALGDVTAVRDLMHVDDHVNAYLTCLESDRAIGEAVNFCTGRGWTVREVVEGVGRIFGVEPHIVPNATYSRPLDIPTLLGDNAKAMRLLGWTPTVPFEEGLRRTVNHWRAVLAGEAEPVVEAR